MGYRITNLSYDFGQRRASASVQDTDTNGFMSISVPVVPPDNISASELNDYLIDFVRKHLELATSFTFEPAAR